MNKSCNKCEVKLEPGVNVSPSRFRNGDYKCTECLREYNRLAGIKYRKNNPKHWENFKNKIPAGVYGVYVLGQLVYIGESSYPYMRKMIHRSTTSKRSSRVGCLKNKLIRPEEIEFTMLKYVDDYKQRLTIEKKYINIFKPVLNFD